MHEDNFRQIEAQWTAAFTPPYEGRVERRDYGMRVGLAVFRLDGGHAEKAWERPENLVDDLAQPGILDAFIQAAQQELASPFS